MDGCRVAVAALVEGDDAVVARERLERGQRLRPIARKAVREKRPAIAPSLHGQLETVGRTRRVCEVRLGIIGAES